jgi:uncharacterized membrane protein
MVYLVLGLVLFLGVHSVRIVAEDWRSRTRNRVGENTFKGVYSLISAMGLALIVWGFSVARETPLIVWIPPLGMRHAAALLTWLAFVLLTAAYVPGNGIKARVHHPMVLGVKTWALAHLMANGMLAHIVLFGAFLVWAVLDFSSARRRDRRAGTVYAQGSLSRTGLTVVIGSAVWALFAFSLHGLLMGVKPFG